MKRTSQKLQKFKDKKVRLFISKRLDIFNQNKKVFYNLIQNEIK
mgnify:FL=1